MDRTDLVAQAVRLALATGMAGLAAFTPAYAENDPDDVAIQEKVVVTGSRIKRTDYEGPLPVTVITREDIDASGELSVQELLRTQTFNTFGSAKQSGDTPNGNVNTISMRGLGPWYTLVLVNGRRMASAPTLSSSVQNLSMIPLAAVERIEILRDGASAIYGTDALAGVINIILRKDYSGISLNYTIGRPSQSGGNEDSYSITGGITGARGNVTFGMDVQQQDNVYQRDREFTEESRQWFTFFGFPSTYFAYMDAEDPRNPLETFLSVGTFPDPRCPTELQSDPDFPWSVEEPSWVGTQCSYQYWGEAAWEAANDTKTLFVDTSYEITDRTEFFARGIFSDNEVESTWAPSPVVVSPTYGVPLEADSPLNPTNPDNPVNYHGDSFPGQSVDIDTDGDGVPDVTVDGPFDLSVGYRNVPGGNRDREWNDTFIDYVAGLRGTTDMFGGMDWELAAQWSEQSSDFRGQGEVLTPLLLDEIAEGNLDIFGIYGPYGDDEIAAANRATATRSGDARHRITGGDGQISFDAFQLDTGAVPVVLGFEYRDDDFDRNFDEQTSAGAFGGDGADIQDMSGARTVKSLFAETAIPLPARLDINLAARYDDYNDFGSTVNPKLSVAFRPLDTLLLRASYGTGFKAPELETLYEPPSRTGETFIDSWGCSQTDADLDGDGRADIDEDQLPARHPCRPQDFGNATFSGNRDLQPEESDNWTAGIVWSPTADVSLMVDYYNTRLDNEIWGEESQPLLDDELRRRQAGESGARVGDVVRTGAGRISNLYITYENIDRTETDGLDAEGSYAFSIGPLGDVSAVLRWTHVLSFEKDYNDGRGIVDWAGEAGFPQDRGQLIVNWALGDYSATIVGNYTSDQDGSRPWSGDEDHHLASFTTWDVQASYMTPWNGQITIGARNVFDRDPPEKSWGSAYYDRTQHEIYGRVPYLRLEQNF
jgi:iron complex outermembrane receptor protein